MMKIRLLILQTSNIFVFIFIHQFQQTLPPPFWPSLCSTPNPSNLLPECASNLLCIPHHLSKTYPNNPTNPIHSKSPSVPFVSLFFPNISFNIFDTRTSIWAKVNRSSAQYSKQPSMTSFKLGCGNSFVATSLGLNSFVGTYNLKSLSDVLGG